MHLGLINLEKIDSTCVFKITRFFKKDKVVLIIYFQTGQENTFLPF